MPRRALSLMLLAILAVQLLGAIAFASVCVERCPDDAGDSDCPPVCATCATCTHSRIAIVQGGIESLAFAATAHAFPPQVFAASASFAMDIFHVPLAG
jgi:hypothetical protein